METSERPQNCWNASGNQEMNVRRLHHQQPHMPSLMRSPIDAFEDLQYSCRLLNRLQGLGVGEVTLQDLILLLCVPTLHVPVQARHGLLRLVVLMAASVIPWSSVTIQGFSSEAKLTR